ncbi:hypothetical protein FRC04_002589 [Tulasnella sp. 424]|nr:hypothetical protein FRC04_002589 [Tulasnella sp. 424]
MTMDVGLSRLIGFSADIAVSGTTYATLEFLHLTLGTTPVFYSVLFVLAIRKRVKSNGALGFIPAVLSVDIYRAFFVWNNLPGGSQAYFFDCSNKILPARDAILWILSFITDGLIIWRLFVVWLQNIYIVIIPCLLLVAGMGTGMVMYYYTIGRMLENSMRLTPEIDKWWIITLGFTIAVNVITPGLIIIRLWWIAQRIGVIGSRSSRPYKQIACALMESGSLYTAATTSHLVIFAFGFVRVFPLNLLAPTSFNSLFTVSCTLDVGLHTTDDYRLRSLSHRATDHEAPPKANFATAISTILQRQH